MSSGRPMMWFCGSPEGNKGPFTREQMEDLILRGLVQGTTYIWREGFPTWVKVQESGDFAPPSAQLERASRTPTPAEPTVARAAEPAAAAQPAAIARIPNAASQDEYMDSVFVGLVKSSWARHGKRLLSTEVDEVLVGAVITATLDNGYALIDLNSTGTNHYLRFERLEAGSRIIFQLTHHGESLLTSQVLGHQASVTIGYGERVKDFGAVYKAVKQEIKGGYIQQAEPGIITVDGDFSSQYIYVEVGMIWDINEYLNPDNPYQVNYPKLTEHVQATVHALRKYLHGRLRS